MPDNSPNDAACCDKCGAPGHQSMVMPFGSIHAREGMRYRCGRTEPESGLGSSSCDYAAALRAERDELRNMIDARRTGHCHEGRHEKCGSDQCECLCHRDALRAELDAVRNAAQAVFDSKCADCGHHTHLPDCPIQEWDELKELWDVLSGKGDHHE